MRLRNNSGSLRRREPLLGVGPNKKYRAKTSIFGIVLILGLVVAGCSAGAGPAPEETRTSKVTPLHNPEGKAVLCDDSGCVIVEGNPGDREGQYPQSEASKQILADERLTREEYETAFANYVACMAELGYSIRVRDASSKYIDYSPETGEDETFCYDTHYFAADYHWQVYEQPRESSAPAIEHYISCLNDAGIKPLTEEIPEDWREQVHLANGLYEQAEKAWLDGLLTKAQEDACFKS